MSKSAELEARIEVWGENITCAMLVLGYLLKAGVPFHSVEIHENEVDGFVFTAKRGRMIVRMKDEKVLICVETLPKEHKGFISWNEFIWDRANDGLNETLKEIAEEWATWEKQP